MPGFDNHTPENADPPVSRPPFVQVENVSKSFKEIDAVRGVNLKVQHGQILGLVGSDGAGKSTLLRMIATMLKPSSGKIFINRMDVVTQRSRVKPLIGYMPQRFGLYSDLTVQENLDFFMDIFGISGPERVRRRDRYLGFCNLLPFVDRIAGALSGGMKQKLGLACVLAHQPKLLILDEPTNGVDPVSRKEFWDILFEMKKEGMTILISTAYLDEGEKCDFLALMHKSCIIKAAAPKIIQSHYSDLEEAMIQHIKDVDKELVDDRFGI
jgi:ABC-2 type transport system ATP-binding protein